MGHSPFFNRQAPFVSAGESGPDALSEPGGKSKKPELSTPSLHIEAESGDKLVK